MTKRIKHIDNLKGFAILFMVMGHIAQLSMGLDHQTTPFVRFFASFHMPLFMFLSGFFVYKHFEFWNFKEYKNTIINKTRRILCPFFVVGGLYSYSFTGSMECLLDNSFGGGYWFLPALYFCTCIDITLSFIIKKIKSNISCDIFIRLISWSVFVLIYFALFRHPYFRSGIVMYPFFLLGTFVVRYPKFKKYYIEDDRIVSIFCVFYILIWLFVNNMPFNFNFLALFSVPVVYYIFSRLQGYMPKQLSVLGKYSMEIYVFHRFFLPSLLFLNNIFNTNFGYFDKSCNFTIYLLVTFIIAVPICYICICIAKAIKELPIINAIVFGSR